MRKQKRDRHTLESDRKNNFGKLSSRDPWEKAREQIRRPAYAPGRQMEHESVDQYVRRQEHGRV
ncbi:hypothetical protein [[Clostridium] scindens]|uniref:hypothetical protein n=1 Tax=Clostridium scindens (strain JCM 10418 / VPI 12708) TaxID=29347 RepID=UPI003AB18597